MYSCLGWLYRINQPFFYKHFWTNGGIEGTGPENTHRSVDLQFYGMKSTSWLLSKRTYFLFGRIKTCETGDQPNSDSFPYFKCSLNRVYIYACKGSVGSFLITTLQWHIGKYLLLLGPLWSLNSTTWSVRIFGRCLFTIWQLSRWWGSVGRAT